MFSWLVDLECRNYIKSFRGQIYLNKGKQRLWKKGRRRDVSKSTQIKVVLTQGCLRPGSSDWQNVSKTYLFFKEILENGKVTIYNSSNLAPFPPMQSEKIISTFISIIYVKSLHKNGGWCKDQIPNANYVMINIFMFLYHRLPRSSIQNI